MLAAAAVACRGQGARGERRSPGGLQQGQSSCLQTRTLLRAAEAGIERRPAPPAHPLPASFTPASPHHPSLGDVVDFVVCLGGDGVILHAASLFRRALPPVLSFHLGSMGFLANNEFENFRKDVRGVSGGLAGVCVEGRGARAAGAARRSGGARLQAGGCRAQMGGGARGGAAPTGRALANAAAAAQRYITTALCALGGAPNALPADPQTPTSPTPTHAHHAHTPPHTPTRPTTHTHTHTS